MRNSVINKLLDLYQELLILAKQDEPKLFNSKVKEFASVYRIADYREQGEYHFQLSKVLGA